MMKIKGQIFGVDGIFYPGEITIKEGRIQSIDKLCVEDLSVEEQTYRIIPGLCDIHSHGCMGHDVCEATEDDILRMVEFERSVGVTSYCPTTMTYDEEKLTGICSRIANAKSKGGMLDAIKGIYLEGPFISKEKKGAQNEKYIMKADSEMVSRLNKAAKGLIRFVAIAPETDSALSAISELCEDVNLCVAHTNVDYNCAREAFSLGASQVTHLYNAMPTYNHREPGVIGAALENENVKLELICDGIHVHDSVIRNTFKIAGDDRVILISDSMEATGMPDGTYSLGGQTVYVKDKRATLEDGTIAGSAYTLLDCMLHAIEAGVPVKKAIFAATRNPAKALGIYDEVGSIETGKKADILVMNDKFELLKVL